MCMILVYRCWVCTRCNTLHSESIFCLISPQNLTLMFSWKLHGILNGIFPVEASSCHSHTG
uniref:Uncharacterized protein n=1 Tax=Anguilla anguilla TaxID=7936 RepID=A0A0E9UN51_ANGAN